MNAGNPEYGTDGVYRRLGVRVAINGVGPATRLGGLPLHPDVLAAMAEALESPVRMDELQDAAGRHLAALLGVPAVYVTSGASAALLLGTAAALTRGRADLVDRLPDTAGIPNRVVIQAAHRDPYDRAIEAAGAELVTIGYPDTTHPDELRRVLDGTVAAVLFRPGRPGNLLGLEATAAIAHEHDVPVLVDGALFVPPVDRLRVYLEAGADLVAVSGGKGFRGPQGSGLLCGRPDLIAAVGVQHQDMDERVETWPRNHGAEGPFSPPRHGIGRPLKVGREQLVGLVAAIERYVRDPGADETEGTRELEEAAARLESSGAVRVTRGAHEPLHVPMLELDVRGAGADVDDVVRALASRPVPVYLGESEAWRGVLTVVGMALRPGDGTRLADAVIEVLGAAG